MDRDCSGTVGNTRSELSGTAGDVVQARDVSGGIHFHPPRRPDGGRVPVPRQLPRGIRDFVGREGEDARLDAFLARPSGGPPEVVAITGTAGVGKTSLAVRWAHRIQDQFPDGALYVNLRGYGPEAPASPAEALEGLLRSLEVPAGSVPSGLEERAALYRSLLASRRALVVLDNAATAGQVRPLLPGTGGCLVVVTSRSRLSGLVARDGARRLPLDILSAPEAVELVRVTTNGYRPPDDAVELAELAGLCAGLPLALRIAAERAASHPHHRLADLIADLRGESSLWDALSTDDGEEADSVRAVFTWSYRALPPPAARLFRLLGLLPGAEFGVGVAAALAGQPEGMIRRLLDLLAGAHLLQPSGTDRYRFHDLLRAYSADQAHTEEPSEDQRLAMHRVLTWYLHAARAASSAVQDIYSALEPDPLAPGVEPPVLVDAGAAWAWYRAERASLPSVVRSASHHGFDRIAWQIPVALHALHSESGASDDWFTMGAVALEAARRDGDRTGEALSHNTLGLACVRAFQARGERRSQAEEHLLAAQAGFRAAGHQAEELEAVNNLGLMYLIGRQLPEARDRFEEMVRIAAEAGEDAWQAVALGNLAPTLLYLGEPRASADFAVRALAAHRALGRNPSACVDPLLSLSEAHRLMGRPDEALARAREALALAEEAGGRVWRAPALLRLGHALRAAGRPQEALDAYQECAVAYRANGDRLGEADALRAAGDAHMDMGHVQEAAGFHQVSTVAAAGRETDAAQDQHEGGST